MEGGNRGLLRGDPTDRQPRAPCRETCSGPWRPSGCSCPRRSKPGSTDRARRDGAHTPAASGTELRRRGSAVRSGAIRRPWSAAATCKSHSDNRVASWPGRIGQPPRRCQLALQRRFQDFAEYGPSSRATGSPSCGCLLLIQQWPRKHPFFLRQANCTENVTSPFVHDALNLPLRPLDHCSIVRRLALLYERERSTACGVDGP
jgi:hypothetical protein